MQTNPRFRIRLFMYVS